VKKLRKSVNICLSYRKNKSVSFFHGPQCITVSRLCYSIASVVCCRRPSVTLYNMYCG